MRDKLQTSLAITIPNAEFVEGREVLALHRRKERKNAAVRLKKKDVLEGTGSLRCEVCEFDFQEKYGDLGEGFAECHHRTPLGELNKETRTELNDLAIVCANCHRMLHRRRNLTGEELRAIMQAYAGVRHKQS